MKKKQIIYVGIGAAVLILFVIGILLYKNRKVTIDLNDYITVEYSGYDTVGNASASWDMDALRDACEDKIRINKKELKKYNEEYGEISESSPFQEMFDLCVMGGLDKNADLTNGETIQFVWNCDTELAKKLFYCNLNCDDKEYTVEGLKEVGQIDPFDNLMVAYRGISPFGKVLYDNNSTQGAYGDIDFTVIYPGKNEEETVKNGDEITISAGVNTKEFIKNYGLTLAATEKTYTVEGLPEYLTGEEELTEGVLAQMQAQVGDKLTEKIQQNIQKNDSQSSKITGSLVSVNYVGSYLMTAKDPQTAHELGYWQNYCHMIYEVTVHEDLQLKTGATKSYDIVYYLVAEVKDIVIDPSGECSVDSSRVLSDNIYKFETDVKQGIFGFPVSFSFDGYESIADYYDKTLAGGLDEYNIATTIQ